MLTCNLNLQLHYLHLHFRVFIKGKPEKYGMKLFYLCEATSGYVCMAEVYTESTDKEDYNSAFNVVDRLVTPYYNKGHTIQNSLTIYGKMVLKPLVP